MVGQRSHRVEQVVRLTEDARLEAALRLGRVEALQQARVGQHVGVVHDPVRRRDRVARARRGGVRAVRPLCGGGARGGGAAPGRRQRRHRHRVGVRGHLNIAVAVGIGVDVADVVVAAQRCSGISGRYCGCCGG